MVRNKVKPRFQMSVFSPWLFCSWISGAIKALFSKSYVKHFYLLIGSKKSRFSCANPNPTSFAITGLSEEGFLWTSIMDFSEMFKWAIFLSCKKHRANKICLNIFFTIPWYFSSSNYRFWLFTRLLLMRVFKSPLRYSIDMTTLFANLKIS